MTHVTMPKGESSTSPARRGVTTHPASAIREEHLDQDVPVSLQHPEGLLKDLFDSQSKDKARGRQMNAGGEALRANSNSHAQQKSSSELMT